MSTEQLKAMEEARLRRRANTYASRCASFLGSPKKAMSQAWLDAYKAALDDAREVIKKAGGPEHNVGADIMEWLENKP